jgi:hypothetical protein
MQAPVPLQAGQSPEAIGNLAGLLRRLNGQALGIALSPEEKPGRTARRIARNHWPRVFSISRFQRN